MSWKPLIEDAAERASYLALAREIADAVSASPLARASADAECDLAVMRTYLGYDDEDDDELVAEALSAAVGRLPEATGAGLYGGAARVGWTIAHLVSGDDAEAVGAAIDRSLTAVVDRGDWPHYDLISGTAGFVVYALERADTDGGRRLAARLLGELERTARPRGPGRAWFTPAEILPAWQRELAPGGYWNLGLAHGVPGVIGALARLLAHGIEVDRARPLLDGAVAFLLDAEPPDAERGRFPGWHPEGARARPPGPPLRLVLRRSRRRGRARRPRPRRPRATTGTPRPSPSPSPARGRPVADSGVADAGLCHGAAGVAHLLNRLHQATGDAELGDAARAWLRRTVEMRRDDAIAGFPSLALQDGDKAWTPDASSSWARPASPWSSPPPPPTSSPAGTAS